MPEKDLQKEILDLKNEIRRLKKNYLGLVFEDKKEDVVTQCQKNIPVLKEVKTKPSDRNWLANSLSSLTLTWPDFISPE